MISVSCSNRPLICLQNLKGCAHCSEALGKSKGVAERPRWGSFRSAVPNTSPALLPGLAAAAPGGLTPTRAARSHSLIRPRRARSALTFPSLEIGGTHWLLLPLAYCLRKVANQPKCWTRCQLLIIIRMVRSISDIAVSIEADRRRLQTTWT
jgi:hypothetical protein